MSVGPHEQDILHRQRGGQREGHGGSSARRRVEVKSAIHIRRHVRCGGQADSITAEVCSICNG